MPLCRHRTIAQLAFKDLRVAFFGPTAEILSLLSSGSLQWFSKPAAAVCSQCRNKQFSRYFKAMASA
jgi:hypothetical protein